MKNSRQENSESLGGGGPSLAVGRNLRIMIAGDPSSFIDRGESRRMNFPRRWSVAAAVLCLSMGSLGQQSPNSQLERSPRALHNPLLPVGPDPWVEAKDGFYYYMNTTDTNLTVSKTRSMAAL